MLGRSSSQKKSGRKCCTNAATIRPQAISNEIKPWLAWHSDTSDHKRIYRWPSMSDSVRYASNVRWSNDHLCKSRRSFEYILVFQDLFTRWVECIPHRKVRGETILKELVERDFIRYGTPEVFLSDNGTEFKNRVIDKFLTRRLLHELVFAYNTMKHSSSGLSPALLNYGRQPAPLSNFQRE